MKPSLTCHGHDLPGTHTCTALCTEHRTCECRTADTLGNRKAEEGCTRCVCGCKYWVHDVCIDCGLAVDSVHQNVDR